MGCGAVEGVGAGGDGEGAGVSAAVGCVVVVAHFFLFFRGVFFGFWVRGGWGRGKGRRET